MSKAFESALEAVQNISPGTEIDLEEWDALLEELSQGLRRLAASQLAREVRTRKIRDL